MKAYHQLLIALLFFACQAPENDEPIQNWLNKPLNVSAIQEVTNTYHMFDSTGSKVGSMIFGFYRKDGRLVARDTSRFDDGSVYEDAEFKLDSSFQMQHVSIGMQVNTTGLKVDLSMTNKLVKGIYEITRDTAVQQFPIDSLHNYDVVREELYMLLHATDFTKGDTLNFTSLVTTSMTVSTSSLYYIGQEEVTVPAGTFNCTVVHLMTDGKMPQNRIWITNDEPKRIVKFHVPGPKLSIELMETRQSL
ncbi:MAG: hypothetical protein RIM99_08035 [Cyclobacteriaceae bacterium]